MCQYGETYICILLQIMMKFLPLGEVLGRMLCSEQDINITVMYLLFRK